MESMTQSTEAILATVIKSYDAIVAASAAAKNKFLASPVRAMQLASIIAQGGLFVRCLIADAKLYDKLRITDICLHALTAIAAGRVLAYVSALDKVLAVDYDDETDTTITWLTDLLDKAGESLKEWTGAMQRAVDEERFAEDD